MSPLTAGPDTGRGSDTGRGPAPGAAPSPAGTVLDGYAPAPGRWDELVTPDGAVRPRWDEVVGDLAGLGPEGLAARRDEVARLLRSEGATYNVSGDGDRWRRPWTLDPCPLVLESAEWAGLERSVAQRAALLDLVLADLYGPRRLVARGLVPAELVLADPAFLRPCDGIGLPGGRHLVTGAVDVVRDGSGRFRAVGDRAQAPSGLGYALVNRAILSRVLPDLHLRAGPGRLAGFFRSLRAGLAAVAPEGTGDHEPRVVILSPGPHNETYFEHAYLAAYLGYALVEGRDLEVRTNRVWVRSLAGLDPVDVVVRRVDDEWCDPVELRPDSLLGVPGLVEVARRGRVSVVNPLGVAVAEHPGLQGLLPTLAPALLGEELALRGPESWWCGTPTGADHVLAHLEELVVAPVHPTAGTRPVVAATLSAAELDELRARIRHRPSAWVGQEYLPPSTAPTVGPTGALEPRPTVLRTFVVADDRSGAGYGYAVLPGGLTRVGATPDAAVVSSRGGTSKDTWVATAGPALQQSAWLRLADAATPQPPPVDDGPVPSRVAARLFALGQASEHTEVVIRLLRTVLARLDQPAGGSSAEVAAGGGRGGGPAGGAESLRVLVAALRLVAPFDPATEVEGPGDLPATATGPEGGRAAGPDGDPATAGDVADRWAMAATLDRAVDDGLVPGIEQLVDAAYSVREQLSVDTWQLIGDLEEELARVRGRRATHVVRLQGGLQRLLQSLLALAGLAAESMERDSVWRFLDAGRRLERAHTLVRLVRAVLVDARPGPVEDLLVESLLTTSDSLIVFRRRTRSTVQVAAALDLLVHDAGNPRSVLFQLDRLRAHLGDLPRPAPAPRLAAEEQLLLEATTALRLSDPERLAEVDPGASRRPELDDVLGRVDGVLADLLGTVRRTWFAHERLSSLAGRDLVPEPAAAATATGRAGAEEVPA